MAITDILASVAPQIAGAVRERLAALVGGDGAAEARRGRPVGSKAKKYDVPTHCIAPGCNSKHGGPRSGWFCERHQQLSAADKAKIKAQRKGGNSLVSKRKISPHGLKRMREGAKARWAKQKAKGEKKPAKKRKAAGKQA